MCVCSASEVSVHSSVHSSVLSSVLSQKQQQQQCHLKQVVPVGNCLSAVPLEISRDGDLNLIWSHLMVFEEEKIDGLNIKF